MPPGASQAAASSPELTHSVNMRLRCRAPLGQECLLSRRLVWVVLQNRVEGWLAACKYGSEMRLLAAGGNNEHAQLGRTAKRQVREAQLRARAASRQ